MFADWPKDVAVIGDRQKVFRQNIEYVFDPIEIATDIPRLNHPGRAEIREGYQMSGEIATVDRRNIFRFQWLQVCCVVPVVEMAPVLFHALDCSE